MKTVAIMQPYFFPYAGYFRLFSEADVFVIYDCVQFPRMGRVHRTQVPGPSGEVEWLTLPLARQVLKTTIRDRLFLSNARAEFDRRLARFPWIRHAKGEIAERIREYLYEPLGLPIQYLESGLLLVADILGVRATTVRSSTLNIEPDLHGQDRVIAVTKAVGGTRYLNSPGGRDLYDEKAFAQRGLELSFLPPYEGPGLYMLHSLMTLPAVQLSRLL